MFDSTHVEPLMVLGKVCQCDFEDLVSGFNLQSPLPAKDKAKWEEEGGGNAKIRYVPCPKWLEVICLADLSTLARKWHGLCFYSINCAFVDICLSIRPPSCYYSLPELIINLLDKTWYSLCLTTQIDFKDLITTKAIIFGWWKTWIRIAQCKQAVFYCRWRKAKRMLHKKMMCTEWVFYT